MDSRDRQDSLSPSMKVMALRRAVFMKAGHSHQANLGSVLILRNPWRDGSVFDGKRVYGGGYRDGQVFEHGSL